MKVSNITFGQTYYYPSLTRYMQNKDKEKVLYSYSLGEIYPVDIFIGSNRKRELTVEVRHCSAWDCAIKGDAFEPTEENIEGYLFARGCELAGEELYGNKYPSLKKTVKDISRKNPQEIKYDILDIIAEYYEKYGNQFLN